jgi:ParB-like chromosome segregation protein Spo0J
LSRVDRAPTDFSALKFPEMAETATWPADQIERLPIEKLIPYARNARKHSPTQIAEIAGSIREWGWTIPVLVDEDGQIIAGHGRVLAAHQLALAEVPVVIARGWSDAQKRAYTIADNEIASHATWNKELLRVELADLQAQAFDLEKIGFASSAIQEEAENEELPRALQLEPAREYALIVCADADEWERLKVALDLTPVRRGGYKKGSPFDDVGTQRVVRACDVLPLIERTG